jgi:putative endonuclease
MFFTYILQSKKTNKFYVGSCFDLEKRLNEHNSGKTKSTRSGVPWFLFHSEKFNTRQEAYKRERQIKSYKGGNAFKKIIQTGNGEVA